MTTIPTLGLSAPLRYAPSTRTRMSSTAPTRTSSTAPNRSPGALLRRWWRSWKRSCARSGHPSAKRCPSVCVSRSPTPWNWRRRRGSVASEIQACPACGVVNDRANTVIAELSETVTQLGIEVASKRKAIKALRSDQSGEHPPEYDDAMGVAEYWLAHCPPRARELNGTRLRNTVARLRAGYDVDTLKQAIDGYAARPNVKDGKRVREGGRRFCDL